MVFFSKLNDSVEDLFSNGYKSLGAFSLKSKSKTNNGVKLEFSGKKKNGSDTVTGGIKFSETFKKDDLVLDLSGNINEEGTLDDTAVFSGFADGIKVELKGTLKVKDNKGNKLGGKITYENDKVGLNAGVSKQVENAPVFDFDIAGVVTDNISVGVSVSAPLKKVTEGKVCDTDFSLKLSSDDVKVVCNLTDTGKKVAVAAIQTVNDKVTVGIELTNKGFALPWCYKKVEGEQADTKEEVEEEKVEEKAEEKKAARDWGLTLGASYKTDSNATFNAKLNDVGVATVSYDFELKENLRANFAAETNISSLGSNTKLGLGLTYSN